MKNSLVVAFGALVALRLSVLPVNAQYGSTVTTKQCVVQDLKVRSSTQNRFYDNMDSATYLFKAGDLVEYSVVIENSSNQVQNDVSVSYILPPCSSLVFGPNQKELKDDKLSWTIPEIKAKESKTYTIRVKITENCALSKVVASSAAVCKSGGSSSDTSTVYVGKSKSPETGPEDVVLRLALVVGMLGAGYALRKSIRGF